MRTGKVLLVILLALAFLAPAIAIAANDPPNNPPGSQNPNANSNSNSNSAQGGAGGAGGQGGSGGQGGQGGNGQGGQGGNSQNDNSNRNHNRNSNRNHQGQAQGQGQGQGQSQAQDQQQSAIGSGNVTKFDNVYQAPAVSAPGLTSAPETCMGSTSLGISGPMAGLSFGSTYKNEDCELRMYSKRLQELGQKEAALAILSTNAAVAAALAKTGFKAAWFRTEKDQTVATPSSVVIPSLPVTGDARNHNSP